MSETLFNELKNIGISEELAAKVSASLDPDYNPSSLSDLRLSYTATAPALL
ncbi:hypothetical protein [Endozoicomonas sp. 8E]|uniref:hypothetical protein n=1 Tax=Endozoicomonas sp. 8E TaxID=3035692 RepID=UPI002938EC54|nr:hypothetical protein [Endozoicomonas sp. 8E]WOG28296.1 hypothetical protein P6910_01200 [Endozoicomonas sp. 8E]